MKTVLGAWCLVLCATVIFGCKKDAEDGRILYGNVTDRELQMAFMISGRIDKIIPEVGTPVKKGDLLATLESARIEEEIAVAKSAVAVAEANVLVAKAQREKAENGSRKEDIKATGSARDAYAAKAEAAKLEKERTAALVKTGAVPKQQADNAEAEYLYYSSLRDSLRSMNERLTSGEREEDREAARAKVRVAEQEVVRAKAQLAVAERALKDAKLVAPTDGIVRDRLLEPGELAAPSRPVLSLAATNPKWIRCYLGETNLAKHKLNDKAKIKADGCEKPFDGWIGYISPTAEFTPKTIETDELRPTLVYETRVYVNDPEGVLKLGAPVVVELQ